MSCDFGIWLPHQKLSNQQAGEVYRQLCSGNHAGLQEHPAVDAFYADLVARHPEINDIAEDRIDDHDYCPWSCAIDHSAAYVVTACVWSQAERVCQLLHELGRQHGLAVYDPQADHITYPTPNHALQRTAGGRPSFLARLFSRRR